MGVIIKRNKDIISVLLLAVFVIYLSINSNSLLSFFTYAFLLPKDNSGGIFYEYQTLIAGFLAVLGAALTIRTMNKSHKDLVYRNNMKARAYMHDSARELCAYFQMLFDHGYHGLCNKNYEPIFVSNEKAPTEALNALKENIGFLDNHSVRALSILLSKYQVFQSRSKSRNRIKRRKLAMQITDIIELYIWSERIFEYARAVEKKDFNIIGYRKSISTKVILRDDILRKWNSMEVEFHGFETSFSPFNLQSDAYLQERINSYN